MREALVCDEWMKGDIVAGNISLVYDHHKPGILQKLFNIQHDFCHEITCLQHVHLDHDNCMEIIVLRGKATHIKGLNNIVLTMS